MKEDEIRWGILGCGDVTEVKSGPAFDRIEGSRRVAVMGRDGEKAHDYAQRHGVPRWYSDADDLIADPQVNAIYIATPPDSHAEYTLRAARAGKPVYVEKPMARTHGECERMVDACHDAHVPLFVAYYRRRLPTFVKARELIEEDAIGDVRFAGVTLVGPPAPDHLDADVLPWRVLPEISGGGLFFDVGSHQLDLLDFLLGPIGNGIWCFTLSRGSNIDRTDIVGARGRITFSTFGLDQPLTLVRENGEVEEFLLPPPAHVQEPLIQTIVDALRGRGTCPSTEATAARTSKVMDCVVASRS